MKEFRWQTLEYVYSEKSSDWYWTVGIVSVAIAVVAVIFGDALFGVVVAIGAFSLTMLSSRQPKTISVEVTDKGVAIDKTLYPYPALDAFSVDEDHHHGPRLLLKSKKVVMPLITVQVATDPDALRAFLVTHLKQETFDQGILHAALERIGF
ncbi:MAG TPA: hypothetical protein VHE10_01635 [Candidatus Paceibacterota bacterium]|nr:hypothetical protein [Candidatus Paceibacterota bacterium]